MASLSISPLSIFGFIAVSVTLVCYMLEARASGWTLGFAAGCALSAAYGFLQGAWPFGAVEVIWTIVAARRWANASGGAEPIA